MKSLPVSLILTLVLPLLVSSWPQNRIINGTYNRVVPYSVLLESITRISEEYVGVVGGGSLITLGHILTSATITHGFDRVLIQYKNYNGQWYSFSSTDLTTHPAFNPETLQNNIALIKFKLNDKNIAGLVRLPPALANPPPLATIGTVHGFGASSVIPFVFENINYGQLATQEVVDKDECKDKLIRQSEFISDANFCSQDHVHRSSLCVGDHGAGFVVDTDEEPTIIGVASFVTNMCNPDFPAVFTSVGPYVDWINEVTQSG